jgi:hypothetical protein
MIRWTLFLGLTIFCFWLPGAYKRVTHGFRPAKCQLEWPAVASWDSPECDPTLLEQPFTYLAKGGQSYVFLSKDKAYVLKLFRFNACTIPIGRKLKNQWKKWVKGRGVEIFPMKESVPNALGAYKLAFDRAQDLTGLVYVHLNPKKGSLPIIRVKDRIGRSYQIDPAKYRFVLQRRAEPFLLTLDKAEKDGSAQPLIDSCLSLFKKIGDLGLFNRDPIIARNFAFLDGRAVMVDAGSLYEDPAHAQENSDQFCDRFMELLEKRRTR